MSILVLAHEALELPLPVRLLWAATVAKNAIAGYSPHALGKYHHVEVLRLVSEWAEGDEEQQERFRRVMSLLETAQEAHLPIEQLVGGVDDEGYPSAFATLSVCLLNEVTDRNGVPASVAVGNAADSFLCHHLYRQGAALVDAAIPPGYPRDLARLVFAYSRELFERLRGCPDRPSAAGVIQATEFTPAIPALPSAVINRLVERPPLREWEYLQERRTLRCT